MNISEELKKFSGSSRAKIMQGFFKTGKGHYGEGDIFIGVSVPKQREIAKMFRDISLDEVEKLIHSKIHEERLTGLFILVLKYKKDKEEIYNFYLDNLEGVNNWDLVDSSASQIVGDYLIDKDKSILKEFAKSKDIWKRRISIISTYAFIKRGEFRESLEMSKILLTDSHDLIRKAVGWMLREVGKKDSDVLRTFLKENYEKISRTTLRYSIEKFSEEERKRWLIGDVE